MHHRAGCLGRLAVVLVLAASPESASVFAQSPSERHPVQRAPTATERAFHAVGRASECAESTGQWVLATVESVRLGERASAVSAAARRRIDGVFARARSMQDRAIGVRLLGPSGAGDPDAWFEPAPGERLPARMVVLVHGLDEPGDVWADLAPRLRDAAFDVARFDYPNDQSPRDSAVALADALARLRAAGVERVDFVGHSMGGLVCRDALTRPGLYGGDARGGGALPAVDRLIMMGTPNHGSVLAHLRALTELRDHVARWTEADGLDPAALLGFLYDGRGEAGDDLLPCSDYLCELNSRSLPRGVRITSIVGAYSDLTGPQVESLFGCALVRGALGEARAQAWRDEARALVGVIGDGVVPVGSTELKGVDDVVTVTANHRTMIRTVGLVDEFQRLMGDEPGLPPAVPVILERLSR